MKLEEKLELAKKLYERINLPDGFVLSSKRDDEINVDFIWVSEPHSRGIGAFIIDDNGDYLFCPTRHGYEYWKEEYKKGNRTHTN